jgi:hypothetical protein
MAERKRRGPITLLCESRRFRWATLILFAVLSGYPLSFGPACWLNDRGILRMAVMSALYSPVLATAENGRLPKVIDWYARLGARSDDFPFVINGTIHWQKILKLAA